MKLAAVLLPLIACWTTINCAKDKNKGCRTKCPSGGKIYAWGSSAEDNDIIVRIHNKYREMILNGQITGQPRAKYMKGLVYDKNLDRLARNVTRTCKMKHVQVKDDRWEFVGQNLYIDRSSSKCKGANWEKAIKKWFDEHKYYKYPNEANDKTGHYTQVVAQNSTTIGCDYIFFYDARKPKTPYSKLYACNYGPAGNIEGKPPYFK